MLLKRIGHNIRCLRKQAKLSQIDLAVAVGIDRAYLSEIENGHRNFTIMLLQNLATALNIPMEELLK
ncbi:MAG: helix-turn-helix domain-containing protein [Alphaproteobacteria bacterium]